MKDNFASSLAAVLVHEGGYVNHARDPGGATNKGVTQTVYDDWRAKQGLEKRSVREIEQSEVAAIYRKQYWDAIRGDDLPSGVDYCVFDFAVNSGVKRAARFLQEALLVSIDGQIGPITLKAANDAPAHALCDLICDLRLCFLRSLSIYDTFGRGWTRRVEDVRTKAKAMA